MVVLTTALPALSGETVSLFYTQDPLLENLPVLLFYGPSTTGNSTQNSSRIQAHVFTLAGFQTFPRLTISPSSPLYAAVYHLPGEQQGDETCRGLAVSLLSYFAGLTDVSKATLKELAARRRPNRVAPMMFDEMHAGELASRMIKVDDSSEAIAYMKSALTPQSLTCLDVDIVLPLDTFNRASISGGVDKTPSFDDNGLPLYSYGQYDSLINLLGSPSFLPTSKLRRAPSKPTAHSKSRSLLKEQKISLRREMCELVDTEERYVEKIHTLVNGMAIDFRQRVRNVTLNAGELSNNTTMADKIFPRCLSSILELNRNFYEAIQDVLQCTENEAISDIEGSLNSDNSFALGVRNRDPTGTTTFAKELLKWFPEFFKPYQEFIRASTGFPNIINEGLQDTTTDISVIINDIGEQRLRSALIEPVQRLPRYSLFIDNMANLLPASHPALSSLLKARDMITDICALDTSNFADNTRTVSSLKNLIKDWPPSFSPRGRLVNAVDVVQLKPPYGSSQDGQAGLLLLFPDCVVHILKTNFSAVSARGIIAEVDRPFIPTSKGLPLVSNLDKGLRYQTAIDIAGLKVTECEEDHLLWMCSSSELALARPQQPNGTHPYTTGINVFSLPGTQERRTSRFAEEVIRARLESRFSEDIRENDKWALRSLHCPSSNLSLLGAVWEEGAAFENQLASNLSRIRISIGSVKTAKAILIDNSRLAMVACITPLERDRYHIDVQGADGSRFVDDVTSETTTTVLINRLAALIRSQSKDVDPSQISFHRDILQNIPLNKQEHESRLRNFRPMSPVKLISSFLGGSPMRPRSELPILKSIPSIAPQLSTNLEPNGARAVEEKKPNNKVSVVGASSMDTKDTLTLLQDTLATYILSLHSRSGNMVGRVLRGRAGADELVVNELYNVLVQDPSKIQAAAAVPVDILFASFEKFLKIAWSEHMGPILPHTAIENMQLGLDSGKPGEFTSQFKISLDDMTPQNKRALAAIIKLLSELLDASGNDGDRGILIASFSEALITEGNPHECITLLDRLVDDFDNLFDRSPTLAIDGSKTSGSASGSVREDRFINTGSWSSNASSLRKRLGFGTLSRENSKSESESKVASVWRTLSKATKSGETRPQPASLSKMSLVRSRSTDIDTRMSSPLRPASRDRPSPRGMSTFDESQPRPGSSHLYTSNLNPIGEGIVQASSLNKKKRRSSLSDLKPVPGSRIAPPWSPLQPQLRRADATPERPQIPRALPRTPSPHKTTFEVHESKDPVPNSASPHRFGSPQRFGSTQRFGSPGKPPSPQRKENSPLVNRVASPKKASKPESENSPMAGFSPKKGVGSPSGLPTSKVGLSERPWPPNTKASAKKLPQPSQKLRIQSPQKLRERLSNEQKAISAAEGSIKAELAQIGEELSAFKVQPRSPTKASSSAPISMAPATIESLSTKLATLSATVHGLKTRSSAISADLETSLMAATKKARQLDELYQEANAENEALYERFNDELSKILKGVRAGHGVEELRAKMVEAQSEVGRLRSENVKLKREVMILRSSLRDG